VTGAIERNAKTDGNSCRRRRAHGAARADVEKTSRALPRRSSGRMDAPLLHRIARTRARPHPHETHGFRIMPYDSLRDFTNALERAGELHRIDTEVDPKLEISEITDRVVKRGGPALLFTNVRGSRFPVLTNQFGTRKRMAMALGVEHLDEAGDRIRKLFDLSLPESAMEKLGKLLSLAPLANAIPKTVSSGSCQEVVDDKPDLTQLPVLTTWPMDAGPFITLPLVVTKDPKSGRFNVGMYRMQVYGAGETAMHWQ